MMLSRRNLIRMAGLSGAAVLGGLAGAVATQSSALAAQSNWRWCSECEGLFFAGNATPGMCPRGPVFGRSHNGSQSGNYSLNQWQGPGQSGWVWCHKCEGLWFAENWEYVDGEWRRKWGRCPVMSASGHLGHEGVNTSYYVIETADFSGPQTNWRWCKDCQGLWFAGHPSRGACPGNRYGHTHDGSGNYQLRQV